MRILINIDIINIIDIIIIDIIDINMRINIDHSKIT